ncbi:MAG: dihydrofolate reductase family protein [Lacunisphaera sp.]
MGSRTYETALAFAAQGMGWAYGDKPVFVLTAARWCGLAPTVEFYSGDLAQFVNERLRPAFRSIWFVGGGAVAGECLRRGLADEVRYSILPVLIGDGVSFFEKLDRDVALHLLEVKGYKNGMVAPSLQGATRNAEAQPCARASGHRRPGRALNVGLNPGLANPAAACCLTPCPASRSRINFTDIIGKAQRGLQLTDAALAEKAGVTPEELTAVKKGEIRDLPVRKLAKALKLEREALLAPRPPRMVSGTADLQARLRHVQHAVRGHDGERIPRLGFQDEARRRLRHRATAVPSSTPSPPRA